MLATMFRMPEHTRIDLVQMCCFCRVEAGALPQSGSGVGVATEQEDQLRRIPVPGSTLMLDGSETFVNAELDKTDMGKDIKGSGEFNLTLKSDKNPTFSVPESDETYCPQKPTLSEETPDVGEKCHISHESKEAKQKELLGPELWLAQREEWVSTSKLPTLFGKPTSQGGWFNSLTESFTRRKSPDNLTRNTAQYSSKQREEYDDINRRVIKLALKKRTPPYPQPLFPVPLSHVVKCAHETWYEENEQWEL